MELREQLEKKGHIFRTKSDTEVLVHLYEEYGDSFIERCNGMLALCLYDARRQRLYLARDRVGKKPLFYHVNTEYFVFASELKSLFVTDAAPRRVSKSGILDYLAFGFVPTPYTAFADIYQLEPAHYMIVERGQVQKHRYWTPNYSCTVSRSLADAQAEYIELLSTCVKDRLIADVPVGLLLSGGIDSGSIAAIMAEQNISIPAFTIRFENREKDEGDVARQTVLHVGATHEEMFVQINNVAQILPRLVWHYEQPFGDSSAIPTYYVAQMARQRVTVVLNGDGGDECFGGYWRHLFNVWLHRLRWVPNFAWSLVEQTGSWLSRVEGERRLWRWLVWSSRAAQKDDFGVAWYFLTTITEESAPILSSVFANSDHDVFSQLRSYWNECDSAPYLNRVLYSCDLRFHLLDDLLVKMDRATMANSLEARSPFLDHRMIEFAAALPPSWKVHGVVTKWFPRVSMRHSLPRTVINRGKTGFDIPMREWMAGELGDLSWTIVLSERARSRGYFDMQALSNLREAFQARKVDCSYLLYRLMFLELWHRSFIDDFSPHPDPSILVD